jgi:hypothetical protein
MTPLDASAPVAADFARCPADFAAPSSQRISSKPIGALLINVYNAFSMLRQIQPSLAYPLLNHTCNEI